jgi:Dyp-type peroxidase family
MDVATVELQADEIQGNILAGFKNEYITFVFLELSGEAPRARAWLADVIPDVATTTEVKIFNEYFRLARHSGAGDPEASWMNLALTHSGLRALGVDGAELDQLPAEFQQGMRARAEQIGDTGDDAPANWPHCLGSASIHALLIVADDDPARRNTKVSEFLQRARSRGARCIFREDGLRRERKREFEHFGYRDGISQPAIEGFTESARPGQAFVQPGEFVLGYPGASSGTSVHDLLNPQPMWLKNGSFLVFRRLRQNVRGFNEFVDKTAEQTKLSSVLLRAKLVGRYPSGAPLVGARQNQEDPGLVQPALLETDKINDFTYKRDPDGTDVPRAAHIRKANPRVRRLAGEDVRRRRILRRGIPYGREFRSDRRAESAYGDETDRGMCFVCYQRSIADQFEHIQREWMNTDSHPHENDGIDPLATQVPGSRYCAIPGAAGSPIQLGDVWVTTTAGEYFFAPSITAMKQFARVG